MQPKIVVLATGGTIAGWASSASSNVDYRAGELSIAAILRTVPGTTLHGYQLESEQIAQLDSKDMNWTVLTSLALRVDELIASSDVHAVVITHGTDTLEETAFFLHLVCAPSKLVVLTCAMRPANSYSPDGPSNLADAIAIAGQPSLSGVLVTCAGRIHSAVDVQKDHPYRLDAFGSGEAGCVGFVEEGRVRFVYVPTVASPAVAHQFREKLRAATTSFQWPKIEILVSVTAASGFCVDALVAQGVDGLVIAGTGNGTIHHCLESALVRAQNLGVQVRVTTRCSSGRIIPATAGKFQHTEGLNAIKARIALVLQLLCR